VICVACAERSLSLAWILELYGKATSVETGAVNKCRVFGEKDDMGGWKTRSPAEGIEA